MDRYTLTISRSVSMSSVWKGENHRVFSCSSRASDRINTVLQIQTHRDRLIITVSTNFPPKWISSIFWSVSVIGSVLVSVYFCYLVINDWRTKSKVRKNIDETNLYLLLKWAPSVSGAGRVGSVSAAGGVSVAVSSICLRTITFSNIVSNDSSSLQSFYSKNTQNEQN